MHPCGFLPCPGSSGRFCHFQSTGSTCGQRDLSVPLYLFIYLFIFNFLFLLSLLGCLWLMKRWRFQAHTSTAHPLYIALCAYLPKSRPLPSPFSPSPSSPSPRPSLLLITTLLSWSMRCVLFGFLGLFGFFCLIPSPFSPSPPPPLTAASLSSGSVGLFLCYLLVYAVHEVLIKR